jgi:hypothetical protein
MYARVVMVKEALMIAAMLLGAWVAASGVSLQLGRRGNPPRGPSKDLRLIRSFRRVVVGLALLGVGAGTLTGLSWLVALSLIIGGEELLESSVIAAALRDEERRRAAEALAVERRPREGESLPCT